MPVINNKKKTIVLALLVAAAAGGCRFYFQKTTDRFTAQKTRTSVANGKNLAEIVCAGCHYDESTKKYTGIPIGDLPKIGGKLFSANLTHSKKYGMMDQYTDAELMYLLKTGIAKNGKFMPYMMRPAMADADINDLIVYLRSDDAPLTAGDTIAGKTKINLIGRMGIRMVSKPSPCIQNVARPDENDPIAYGKYLVAVIGCYECHSQKIGGLDHVDPEKSKGYMQGGMKSKDFEGKKVRSANLTPDNETGIGRYTETDFRNAVRRGIQPGGGKLSTAMPRFADLTGRQASALYDYLRQLKPVRHAIR